MIGGRKSQRKKKKGWVRRGSQRQPPSRCSSDASPSFCNEDKKTDRPESNNDRSLLDRKKELDGSIGTLTNAPEKDDDDCRPHENESREGIDPTTIIKDLSETTIHGPYSDKKRHLNEYKSISQKDNSRHDYLKGGMMRPRMHRTFRTSEKLHFSALRSHTGDGVKGNHHGQKSNGNSKKISFSLQGATKGIRGCGDVSSRKVRSNDRNLMPVSDRSEPRRSANPVAAYPCDAQSIRIEPLRRRVLMSHDQLPDCVNMLSNRYKIFVIDMIPPEQCDEIRRLASQYEKHVTRRIGEDHAVYRQLYSYTKLDLPCREVPGLARIIGPVYATVIRIIGQVFGRPQDAARLHARSSNEPHLLRYQIQDGIENQTGYTGIKMHYDGSHFTWSLMLSDQSEYEGGGTYFRCLRKAFKLRKGQVLVHPGNLYHKGLDIESGLRELVVCFMDGMNSNISDPSSPSEHKAEFETRIVHT